MLKYYEDEGLDTHVKLFRGAVRNNFPLRDDNAYPYCTALVTDYLESKRIK